MAETLEQILSDAGTVLAFDFGLARTGAAVGNTLTRTAEPLAVLDTPSNEARWKAIEPLVEEWQPKFFVVGVPRMGDGTPSTLTARCERFARQLGGRFRRRVFTVDERFSSVEVARGRERIDDAAAAVILEQFFREAAAEAAAGSNP